MQDGPDDPDKKTEWAEARTDWAEDRTMLANERTFAGWMRTAMAAVAVALGLKAVFGEFEPTWIAKAVATVFILVACVMLWSAQQRSRETQRRMNEHEANAQPSQRMALIAAMLALGSVATGVVLWML